MSYLVKVRNSEKDVLIDGDLAVATHFGYEIRKGTIPLFLAPYASVEYIQKSEVDNIQYNTNTRS